MEEMYKSTEAFAGLFQVNSEVYLLSSFELNRDNNSRYKTLLNISSCVDSLFVSMFVFTSSV